MSEPVAAPGPAPSQSSSTSPPSRTPAAPPSGKRPRGFETSGDMLRTVLFVLGLVLVVFFLTARPQGDQRPPADVAASAAQASAAGVPLSAPQLPEGWKASTTRFGPDVDEGLPTFEAGYLDPAGAYGGISATAAATPGWVRGIAGQDAASDATREVAGRTWQVWTTTDPRSTTLVSDPSSSGGGPALAVTSRGSEASLDALAQAAVAAVGSAPSASATSPGDPVSPSDAASSATTGG